jgi:tol-pal system protein YbgF
MRTHCGRLLWMVVGSLLCACAGSSRRIGDLEDSLRSANERDLEQRRRIDDLENRLFLLEDRIDTARVASERVKPPELPVVKLQPTVASSPAPVPRRDLTADLRASGSSGDETRGEVNPSDVIYEGDAAIDVSRRPALRLNDADLARGSHTARKREVSSATPTVDAEFASARNERLGVVPLPDGRDGDGSAAPLAQYLQAHEALGAGHYDDAVARFRAFLREHPKHDYADNALYWLGECFYAQRDWKNALEQFRVVVERYPDGNKVPDAVLKAGYAYLALGDQSSARRAFEEVTRSYPRSEAARLAQAKLTEDSPR